jgi:hypothetical protein
MTDNATGGNWDAPSTARQRVNKGDRLAIVEQALLEATAANSALAEQVTTQRREIEALRAELAGPKITVPMIDFDTPTGDPMVIYRRSFLP